LTPALIIMACGVQIFVLGIVGEYVGRLFQQQSGMPPYVVRYTYEQERAPGAHRLNRQGL
jgi:dolichol-phosphate mannosyltransferase